MQADGRTDGQHDQANSHFWQFCVAPKKFGLMTVLYVYT